MANWRDIGPTSLAAFEAEIRARAPRSPLLAEVEAIYEAVKPHSRLFLGMCWIEDQFQTDPSDNFPLSFHNLMNMKTPDGSGWMEFDSYAAGSKGWIDRITSPTYKNGIYAKTETVAELVHVYAPAFDNNDEANYVRTIEAIVAELKVWEQELGGVTPPSGGGTDVAIDVNFERALINRSYGSLTQQKAWLTLHNTGNTVKAWAEHSFFKGGGGDQAVLVGFVVDEDEILQLTPMHTRGRHAGSEAGNNTSIAIEMTARRNVFAQVEENTAKLMAMIYTRDPRIDWSGAEAFTFHPSRTTDHRGWHGGAYSCPAVSAERHGDNVVPFMVNYAAKFTDGVKPVPVPKVTPHLVGGESDGKGRTKEVNGTLWLWVNKMFFMEQDLQAYEYANLASRKGPKYKGGKNIRICYIVGGDGENGEPELFGTTRLGWRVRLKDLV